MTKLNTQPTDIPMQVLVVDDEPEFLDILALEVSNLGCVPTLAANGTEALAHMIEVAEGKKWIDLIISDINMPSMNGMTLLHKIRGLELQTPFVFLSAYGDKDKTVEALRLGAYDFLDKPYKHEEFEKVVTGAVKIGRLMRDLEHEVVKISKKYNVTEVESETLKAAQKEVLKSLKSKIR